MPKISELGAELVSIPPNLCEKSLELTTKNSFSFHILSDDGNSVARQFGIDIEEYDGNNSYELPIPAIYVLGRDGLIMHAFVEADYTTWEEPGKVVEVLKSIKG